MSDNLSIKDGNGSNVVVASDDISSVQYPRHKVTWGADGTANDTSAANPLPVSVASLSFDGSGFLLVNLGVRLDPSNDSVVAYPAARTTGGATPYKLISGASTNATSLKNSAGTIYAIEVYNASSSVRYLKLYNKASSPTVGTDTPVRTILIPTSTSGAGVVRSYPVGIAFSTGIAFAITGALADADTTSIGAADVVVNFDYI